MKRRSFEIAIKIFKENNGILRTFQAKKLGINENILAQMRRENILFKEATGLYRLMEMPPLSNPDLVQIAIRVPEAVICLLSALNFHDLTTQIPYKVYIALPQEKKAPRINYPPIDVVYLSQKAFLAGILIVDIDNIPVRVYSREKTVVDCFKFRNKIGLEIALEALKDYLRTPNHNIDELLKYARIDRVEKVMLPYLQGAL